jgi:hypothetical protein
MSMYDYQLSKEIAAVDWPLEALIMAAMMKADSANTGKLRGTFPDIWDELEARHNAPGGALLRDQPERAT